MWETLDLPGRDQGLLPAFVADLPEDGSGLLALFDGDGTLWRNDAADDFTLWMIEDRRLVSRERFSEYQSIYRRDPGEGCEFLLSLFQGIPRAVFLFHVRAWWRRFARRQWVPEAIETLRTLAERGYTVWLVTGSPTDTMQPLTEALPITRVVGMDFETDDDGIITGRLEGISCTDRGKAEKVRSLSLGGEVAVAVGNGGLDVAMMEIATRAAWSVYPGPELQALSKARGWPVLERPLDFVEEAKLWVAP